MLRKTKPMQKISLLLFLICFGYASTAQKDNRIVIGTVDSVRSAVLNETRKIWIYVPNRNSNSIYGAQNYPVIYLLDAEAHFHSVTGLIHQLSAANGNSICPEMIVVGIPNTDRTRDLTPTHSLMGPEGKELGFLATSGGGENFTAFLEKELIPYIDAHYPTAPHRMLIGHSFGGLFAINALVHHPMLFNSYVSIDPSLWWDHQKLLNQASDVLQSNKLKGRTLFLGVANTMRAGMDTLQLARDTAGNTFHIRSILKFAKNVRAASASGLRFSWKYYPGDDHGSVPLITEYDALRFIFDFYKPPAANDSNPLTADFLITYYKNLSEKIGYPFLPPESVINGVAYGFLQRNMLDKAYTFFKMNIDNYPKSANVYDSMGDYYIAKNEKVKAIEYFARALTLKEVPETRKKMERLKTETK